MPGLFPVCVHHVYKMKCVYLRLTVYCTHIRVVQEAEGTFVTVYSPDTWHRHWHLAPTLASGIDTGTGTGTDTVALPREYVCTLW
jgi:hypothetical protein